MECSKALLKVIILEFIIHQRACLFVCLDFCCFLCFLFRFLLLFFVVVLLLFLFVFWGVFDVVFVGVLGAGVNCAFLFLQNCNRYI